MTGRDNAFVPDVFPCVRYLDPNVAVAFLRSAFRFEEHLVVRDDEGSLAHVEMRVGSEILMLGYANATDRSPYDLDGANTGNCYVGTPDVAAIYASANASGAQIVSDLASTDDGSLDFSARDPEGRLWRFGTDRPQIGNGENDLARSGPTRLYASLAYADARAARAWLCETFGFRERSVVIGPGDTIARADVSLGSSIVMLATRRDDDPDVISPRDLGASTLALAAYVPDVEAHYERARAAGAEILAALATTEYGALGYVARDPEGYAWNFASYRPEPFA